MSSSSKPEDGVVSSVVRVRASGRILLNDFTRRHVPVCTSCKQWIACFGDSPAYVKWYPESTLLKNGLAHLWEGKANVTRVVDVQSCTLVPFCQRYVGRVDDKIDFLSRRRAEESFGACLFRPGIPASSSSGTTGNSNDGSSEGTFFLCGMARSTILPLEKT